MKKQMGGAWRIDLCPREQKQQLLAPKYKNLEKYGIIVG